MNLNLGSGELQVGFLTTGNGIVTNDGTTLVLDTANSAPVRFPPGINVEGVCKTKSACAADLAELFLGKGVEAGDVVSLGTSGFKAIRVSEGAYDPMVAGVVSTDPTVVMGHKDAEDGVPIALAGVVPVKVTLDNGPIAVGDLLTSSSTPGYAMRADRPGPTVGKAMEAFDGSAGWQGSIRILVAPSACVGNPSGEEDGMRARIESLEKENRSLRRQMDEMRAWLGLPVLAEPVD